MTTYLDSSDEEDYVFELEAEERRPTEPFVNDVDGLKEKLQEFAWKADLGFAQTQEVLTDAAVEVEDVDDDLERELSFYNQALDGAKRAMRRFETDKTAWLRPEDYYAEMVKSDAHMARIKDQLLYEQKRIALATERRKARDAKKFAKQVHAARQQEKQAAKKATTKRIQQLRTQRKRMGFGQEFDWDVALDKVQREETTTKKKKGAPTRAVKSGKRMYKDAKYGRSGGFGPAAQRKRNTAESSGDMRTYKPGKKAIRPGKRRRQATVAKRNSRL